MKSESLKGNRLGNESHENTIGVELSPRQTTDYRCSNDHLTSIIFAAEAEVPTEWDCKKCSQKAKLVSGETQEPIVAEKSTRTHFDLVLERRTRAELEVILKEAIADLRKRRKKAS